MSRHLRRLERQKTVGEKVGEALRASSAAQSLPLRALAEALDGASDDGSDPSAVLCNPHATMMGTAAAAKKAKRKRAKAAAAAAAAAAEATGDDSDEEEVEEECEVAGVEEDTEEEEAGAVEEDAGGDSGDAGAEDGEGRRRRPAEQTLRRRRGPASACAVGVAPASLPQRRDEDLTESLEEVERLCAEAARRGVGGATSDGEDSRAVGGGVCDADSAESVDRAMAVSAGALDAAAELRRMFGAGVAAMAEREEAQGAAGGGRRRNRLPGPAAAAKSLLVTPEPAWPPVDVKGFDIVLESAGVYAVVETGECLKVSRAVRASMVSDDVNRLQMLVQRHPWHLRACYQYGVMACLNGRTDEGATVFKRAAHAVAVACRGSFSLLDTSERRVLPYRRDGSDVVYMLLQQLMHIHVRAGCLAAACEVAKVLLNLDPTDPCGAAYNLEYLAVRAVKHSWYLRLLNAWQAVGSDQCLLPAATYGRALCFQGLGDRAAAEAALAKGLLEYPLLAARLVREDSLSPADLATFARWAAAADVGAAATAAPATSLGARTAAVAAECYAQRMAELWAERGCQALLLAAVRTAADWVEGEGPGALEARSVERDLLLGGASFAHAYVESVRPAAVLGVVDEVMPGRDQDRLRLQRTWAAPLNALPTAVRHMVLDHLTDLDYSPLATDSKVSLFLRTLLPWNSMPLMLGARLLERWKHDNPREADEWDTDVQVQQRLRQRGLI